MKRCSLLTDGDVVFQPRKVDRSGLSAAVGGHVLIYLHEEQELARHHGVRAPGPIRLRPRRFWRTSGCDISLDRISDLLDYDLAQLLTFRDVT